jgi:histidine triad (HIT) family protein
VDADAVTAPAPAVEPGCTFCRIVTGDLPAHVVLDDDVALAFLDTRPLFPGHTLVVPRAHHVTLLDLPPGLIGPLFERARWVAGAVEDALGAQGSFVALNNTVSQSVPHLHVHVAPRTKGDGLRGFFWPRTSYRDDDHAADVAQRLRAAVDARAARGG